MWDLRIAKADYNESFGAEELRNWATRGAEVLGF
jgi:hypothetical protein